MFTSRVQEGKDVRAGLESTQAKLKALQDEEDDLRKKLAQVETPRARKPALEPEPVPCIS